MIIPTWKKLGSSTHQLAQTIGAKTAAQTQNIDDKKATHTGTLDPMAEGIVVVLTGADRFKKGTFTNWKKTYEFEILFGVTTDSHDLLGLQTKLSHNPLTSLKIKKKLLSVLPRYIGKQTQTQPQFSAQRINGKSGFDLGKTNNNFSQKKNSIEIFSLQLFSTQEILISELKKNCTNKIATVTGNFRQKEITENWNQTFKNLEQNSIKTLPVFKLVATVSKRTYIRALVHEFSTALQVPATTYSITRIQEGPYSKKNFL